MKLAKSTKMSQFQQILDMQQIAVIFRAQDSIYLEIAGIFCHFLSFWTLRSLFINEFIIKC